MAGIISRWITTNTKDQENGNPVSDLLRQCKRSFIFVMVMTFLLTVMSLTPMIYLWNVFDRVLASRSEPTLISLTIVVLIAYGFWAALEWIRTRILIRISLRIDWDIAARVFDTAFRRYVMRKQVNVHQVMDDVVNLRQFLTGSGIIAMMTIPFVPVFIIVGFIMHPYLGTYIVLATIVEVMATVMTVKITTPALREAASSSAEANRLASQSVRQAETALALGMHPAIRRRWHQKHLHFLNLQVNASESAGLLGGVASFISHANGSLIFGVAIFLSLSGVVTPGIAIGAMLLLRMAMSPIKAIADGWEKIALARQSLERLNDMVAEDNQVVKRLPLPPPQGHLTVDMLIAQPQGAKAPVIFNVNFKANPGEVIAVVGPSAAGKSSLLRLLAGIWIPTRGSARLDGADISNMVRDDGGHYFGYVPQDIEFFDATIAENIARLQTIDPEQVVAAAMAAGVHEMILSFPNGYESSLGEVGQVLTGGQKQRMAIARALYGKPKYIVMDEPNANLDEQGERELVELVKSLKAQGCLVIFSTHRPLLISVADRILLLKNGQQVAMGSMKEMLTLLGQPLPSITNTTTPSAPKGISS